MCTPGVEEACEGHCPQQVLGGQYCQVQGVSSSAWLSAPSAGRGALCTLPSQPAAHSSPTHPSNPTLAATQTSLKLWIPISSHLLDGPLDAPWAQSTT